MHSRGDLVGTELEGRYRILSRLGEGGMGTVYVAQHLGLGSRCAVKVLRSELCASATARERFLREARIASQLGERNPHIVKVMDLGCLPDGSGFYAMEWLQGEDLAATLTRAGRLPWPRVRHFALQICAALAGAHAAGIVHRDLKPENCFRVQVGDDPDFIKLLDFGVAHMTVPGTGKLTEMGQALGTAAYMSPEQAAGQGGDHRIDIYALGVIMYEMLTGYQPFEATNAWLMQAKIVSEDPPAMAALCPEAELGPELEALVTTAMRRRPEQRFASVAELAAAIAAVRHLPPPVGPRGSTLPPSHRDTAYAATLAASLAASPAPSPTSLAPPTPAPRPHVARVQLRRPASPPRRPPAARSLLALAALVVVAVPLVAVQWLRSDAAEPAAPPPADPQLPPQPSSTPSIQPPASSTPPIPTPPIATPPIATPPIPPPSPVAPAPPPAPTAPTSKPALQDLERWGRAVVASPPAACKQFALGWTIDFAVIVGIGGALTLEHRGDFPNHGPVANCSAEVEALFARKRFRESNVRVVPRLLRLKFKAP